MKTGSLKRWTKYVLIISGSVVLLTALAVVVALMVCDDDDYRRLAVWGVQHATGYRMIIEGPFALDLSAEPSLTADRIRFEAVLGGLSPPLKSIGNFHIKIALKPLLRGTYIVKQLQIADVVIEDVNTQQDKTKNHCRLQVCLISSFPYLKVYP